MIDRDKECGACQNLDAYWEERARHDPQLRERLLQLQRQKEPGHVETVTDAEKEPECPDECLEDST
jgi:hypothetical protein